MDLTNLIIKETEVTDSDAQSASGKAQHTVKNFLAEVQARGLAKPVRFEVIVLAPQCLLNNSFASRVGMYADNAFLPQTRLLTSRQQLFGPPEFFPVGVDYGGDNMGINFIVDRDMQIKRYFDTWIDNIVGRQTTNGVQHAAKYRSTYTTNMQINQLDESDTVTYSVTLYDLFPVAVNPLILDNNLTNSVHKLNVTFNYRRWKPNAIQGVIQGVANVNANNPFSIITNGLNNLTQNSINVQNQLTPQAQAQNLFSSGRGTDTFFIVK